MKKGVRRSPVFKWVLFSVLLSTIPLTISGFQIIKIYQKDLRKSIIEAEEMKANMAL